MANFSRFLEKVDFLMGKPLSRFFCHLDNLGVVSGSHREICFKLIARNAGAGRSDLIGRYVNV